MQYRHMFTFVVTKGDGTLSMLFRSYFTIDPGARRSKFSRVEFPSELRDNDFSLFRARTNGSAGLFGSRPIRLGVLYNAWLRLRDPSFLYFPLVLRQPTRVSEITEFPRRSSCRTTNNTWWQPKWATSKYRSSTKPSLPTNRLPNWSLPEANRRTPMPWPFVGLLIPELMISTLISD